MLFCYLYIYVISMFLSTKEFANVLIQKYFSSRQQFILLISFPDFFIVSVNLYV